MNILSTFELGHAPHLAKDSPVAAAPVEVIPSNEQ
jgi:hypothetical protein